AIPFSIFALAEVAGPAVVLAKATALGPIVPDLVVRLVMFITFALGDISSVLLVRVGFLLSVGFEVSVLLSVGFDVSVLLSVGAVFELFELLALGFTGTIASELLPPLLSLLPLLLWLLLLPDGLSGSLTGVTVI